MIKKLLFLGLLSCGLETLQAVVSVGDTADSVTTFQFSVGSAIYDSENQRLWTLSGENLSLFSEQIQAYGISYTGFIPADSSLDIALTSYPYVSTQAIITTTNEQGGLVVGELQANPLLGKAYSAVSFLGTSLTVVDTATPRYVYLIQSVSFSDNEHGTTSADGISILNRLDLGIGQQVKVVAGSGSLALFIAKAQGTFGIDASAIAFADMAKSFAVVNGQNTDCMVMRNQAEQAVTLNTSVLTAGGSDLASIGSSIAFYPSLVSAQMYVGLDVVAAAGLNDRAVGLFTATATAASGETAASLTFASVLPNAVAAEGLQTPVSASADRRVAVSNITTTTTSTGLTYLITARYDGIGRQSVYAMPVVTMSSNSSQIGMIANFDSIEQSFKIVGKTYRTQGFNEVIDDASQIDIEGSNTVVERLQVGGGPVPLPTGQFIKQLVAQGDSVYITIQNAFGVGSTPGMFKSQALFDAQGRIMSWSPWQRVAGTDDQMLFAIKNRFTDATMYVSGANSNTIQQTTWNATQDLTTFISAVKNAMPVALGGVQGLFAISNHTPDIENFTFAIATGNQAVVIGQTGSLNDGHLVMDETQNIATINTDLGLDIGSVVAATFAHEATTNNNWFFMGGDAGLSVLSNDTTGIGFNGQLSSLAALTAGMSCKTLGNFSFVKKVVSSDNFVYVLTPSAVYQIALNANKFKLTNPASLNAQIVVQASTIDQFASFTDMLVDNNIMLLGSTGGLYSLDLTQDLPVTPVSITIPGGLSTVSRLQTISNHVNFDQNFYERSNLYVLTINYAVQQARLNRFTITNGVVTPIQDQLLEGQNGPLLLFDYMRNNIFIDGSLGFATSYKINTTPAAITYLQYTLQAGKSSTQSLLKEHTSNVSIASVANSLGIAGIVRDYASGCLMLGADFGLLTDS